MTALGTLYESSRLADAYAFGRPPIHPMIAGRISSHLQASMPLARALNYVNLNLSLPELARVLAPKGLLVVYDFSAGRRLRHSEGLRRWYRDFKHRYPSPPGYHLDVKSVDFAPYGLVMVAHEDIDLSCPMSLDSYVAYLMGDSGMEMAIGRGAKEADIRDWCRFSLSTVLSNEPQEVLFEAYVAYIRRSTSHDLGLGSNTNHVAAC